MKSNAHIAITLTARQWRYILTLAEAAEDTDFLARGLWPQQTPRLAALRSFERLAQEHAHYSALRGLDDE